MDKKKITLLITNEIIENNFTIRYIASKFKLSKSTIHNYIHKYLPIMDKEKYELIKNIFDKHIKTRHINGGMKTKIKYQLSNINK